MSKTLILIRHAHRETSDRDQDNGLSDKGRTQAAWIKKFGRHRLESQSDIWFASSPKKRCIETLTPLARDLGAEIEVHPDLSEQERKETHARFESRIAHFIEEWLATPSPVTVACSHGDWLPMAVLRLLNLQCDFKKGSWLELEWDGITRIKWFIPSFKTFYG